MLQKLGKNLRTIRLSKNLTQVDVAYAANLDKNYIGMVERGKRNPSFLSLVKIAKGLDVSLSELVNMD